MKEQNNKFRIGTSGYSYPDWKGVFYPPEIESGKMLEFYCRYFNTVEVNATYYKIPGPFVFERMVEKTPPGFEFILKVNQETTHKRSDNINSIQSLLEACKPMTESGKLKGFLAQFPYSFKNNEVNRKYLSETRELLRTHILFTEFRNYTWNNPAVFDFLQNNDISYVNVDEPNLRGLIPAQDITTTENGYIRFHGRNEKDWWDGQGSARYNYEYNSDELQKWLTKIGNILKKTYKTYIFFNNHPQGKAVKNAQQMMEILKEQMKNI